MEIVLLHGFAQSGRSWGCVASLLAERTSAVVHAYEFPGHGGNLRASEGSASFGLAESDDEIAQDYSMESVCDGLLSYLASFDEPPVVVGYSMGGRIAVAALCRWLGGGLGPTVERGVAAERGEAVGCAATAGHEATAERAAVAGCASLPMGALVLESAGLGLASAEERAAAARRNAEWAAMLRAEGVAPFMDYWEALPLFASQKNLPKEVQRRIREGRLANDAEALARTLEGSGAHRMPPRSEVDEALAWLAGEGVPLLYVAGALDSKYAAAAESVHALFAEAGCTRKRAAEYRGCQVETAVVPGCGHNVHEENPAAYVEVLASFLGA